MSAAAFRQRLRDDLKAAMRARNDAEVRLLRALGAAIDNAEAVSGASLQDNTEFRRFGDGQSEVARRELQPRDIAELLAHERGERLAAATSFERLGEPAEALRLRKEAALVARYE